MRLSPTPPPIPKMYSKKTLKSSIIKAALHCKVAFVGFIISYAAAFCDFH